MDGFRCDHRLLRNRCECYSGRIIELISNNPEMILKYLDFVYEDPESTIDLKDYSDSLFVSLCNTCINYETEIYAGEVISFFGDICRKLYDQSTSIQNKYALYLLVHGVTLELKSHLDFIH
jgi:hypothetical protein